MKRFKHFLVYFLQHIRFFQWAGYFTANEYRLFRFCGGKIYLNLQDGSEGWYRRLNLFEIKKTEIFKKMVKPDMVIFDIGACLGYFSLLSAKLMNDRGRIIAIEPAPKNFYWMNKSIKANNYSSIESFQLAVSDKNGRARLKLGKHCGWHSLLSAGNESIEVEVISLDTFSKKNDIKQIDILKIDVEGVESRVLKGAENIIKASPNLIILMELHPDLGVDIKQIYVFLEKLGFKIFKLDGMGLEIIAKRQ